MENQWPCIDVRFEPLKNQIIPNRTNHGVYNKINFEYYILAVRKADFKKSALRKKY